MKIGYEYLILLGGPRAASRIVEYSVLMSYVYKLVLGSSAFNKS